MVEYDAHFWRDHLLDIRGSMLREILYRVLSCVLFSVLMVMIHKYLRPIGISDKGHALVGVALGLLLVFRTNASYDRFWEGRKLWGAIVNTSRNLGRSASVLLHEDPMRVRRVLELAKAFAYATMIRLRDGRDFGEFQPNLPSAEVAAWLKAPHVPLALATALSQTLREARDIGRLSDYNFVAIDQNIQLLVDHLGACERIHNTPLPFAYVVHLRRALLIYCFSLPLVLVDLFGWWTILVTWLISYVLLGIEEIGVEIADPFGTDDNDLPLERICKTIDENLTALGQALGLFPQDHAIETKGP